MCQDLRAIEGSSKLIKRPFFQNIVDLCLSPKLPRCEKWLKEGCVDQFDKINCGAAVSFCEKYLVDSFFNISEFLHHKPFPLRFS